LPVTIAGSDIARGIVWSRGEDASSDGVKSATVTAAIPLASVATDD
uniref:BIG2 domain-containing protein n=1 Tax=Gongylonema pulchrum TaxID=637853 RepID=A0A183D956_9BILA